MKIHYSEWSNAKTIDWLNIEGYGNEISLYQSRVCFWGYLWFLGEMFERIHGSLLIDGTIEQQKEQVERFLIRIAPLLVFA
jgi:hypothetical protein